MSEHRLRGVDFVHRCLNLAVGLNVGDQRLVDCVAIGPHDIVEPLLDRDRDVGLPQKRVVENHLWHVSQDHVEHVGGRSRQ